MTIYRIHSGTLHENVQKPYMFCHHCIVVSVATLIYSRVKYPNSRRHGLAYCDVSCLFREIYFKILVSIRFCF